MKDIPERTLSELRTECYDIMSQWNGDESGKQEDDARTAEDIIERIELVIDLKYLHGHDEPVFRDMPFMAEMIARLDALTIRKTEPTE
jgi:hypothetical protein